MNSSMIDSISLKHLSKKYLLKEFIPDNPFIRTLGIRFVEENGSYISILPFRPDLIGNSEIKALHGGGTLSLLEVTAFLQIQIGIKKGKRTFGNLNNLTPSIVDTNVDYLRPGNAHDTFAIAKVKRLGRRFGSVYVMAWQKDYKKTIAQATVRFQILEK